MQYELQKTYVLVLRELIEFEDNGSVMGNLKKS